MRRFFLVLVVFAMTASASNIRVVEEIIAKVNGDIITNSDLESAKEELGLELRQQGLTGAQLMAAEQQKDKDILRDKIDQLLLVQKGKDLDINVDPDVTKRIAEIQAQSKIVDPDKFHDWIRQQTGMSYEDFKAHLKDQLLTQRVIGREISSRIAIPEPEKRKYYEAHKKEFVRQAQVFLRQILISTEGKTPEQVTAAEKKAKALVARARKGENFGELARDNSDDPATAKNYGELPPFKRGELKKNIEEIVFAHNKGYVTDPIRVPNGFLILKVDDRWEAGQASFEEVENEITDRLSMPLMQPRVRQYLTKLRQDAFLQIRDGYADTGAAPGKDTRWIDPAQLKPQTVTKEQVEARRKRKLLWLIPIGTKGPKKDENSSQ